MVKSKSKSKSKLKSKSGVTINYPELTFYIGSCVCVLCISFGYGLYKKQSFSTIVNNLANSVYASRGGV